MLAKWGRVLRQEPERSQRARAVAAAEAAAAAAAGVVAPAGFEAEVAKSDEGAGAEQQ